MKKFKTSLLSSFTSAIAILAMLLLLVGPQFANAATLTTISDTQSRLKASTLSLHKIFFTSTSAIAAGNTIALAFPPTFTTTGLVITDLQICHGATGVEHGTAVVTGGTACTATDETIAASNGASTVWGATITGTTTVTFTAPSGTFTNTITAGQKVTVYITAAHMQNPTASTPTTNITTTSDSGSFSTSIADDDQVSITASVNQTITFDIDTATSDTNSNSLYSVALGTLTTAAASGSNESSINSIWLDLATNATSGVNVTVLSSNGALKSTVTPADTIPSATATMAAGTANYGICVKSATASTGTLTKASPFNGATCTTTPTGNTVGALTTSAQNIITSTAPVGTGRVEIMVDAENSAVTPAHTDYGDTQTYIATGTF